MKKLKQSDRISYEVIRSNRKTISIEITREGEVKVRVPKWCTNAQAAGFVREKQDWILSKLSSLEEDLKRQEESSIPRLTDDELISLKKEAREDLTRRVEYFAPIVGVTYERISIRAQKSRWGSCSGKGNLNFNCLLMLMPEEIRDYVVVHELCHRLEMNHSPHFWAQVERVIPNYRAYRMYLKKYGRDVISRLPN